MVLLGLVATRSINPAGTNGWSTGGHASFFGWEVLAAVVVAMFSFGVTWLLASGLDKTIGLRVSPDDEFAGLDLTQHSESAYSIGGMGRIST